MPRYMRPTIAYILALVIGLAVILLFGRAGAVSALPERTRRAKTSSCMAYENTPRAPGRPSTYCNRTTSQEPP